MRILKDLANIIMIIVFGLTALFFLALDDINRYFMRLVNGYKKHKK